MPYVFEPHSIKQQQAILSKDKYTIVATGIQWGKTRVGAVRMKMYMHQYQDPDDAFLITAPTYKILQQATIPAFLSMMDGLGHFNKQEATFKMFKGGTCYFRTETDPDSIIGITNIRHIWCDEAGLYRLYFWENIEGRASFKNAGITITTSPYARNWLFKDFIKPIILEKRKDCTLIQARSNENPFFPDSVYQAKKQTMSEMRFNLMFGGEWGSMAGLVYDCFDYDANTCEPFELPSDTKYYAGVDWGYTDPFVMVIRGVLPSGYQFQVSEYYKTGMTINDMVQIAKQKKAVFNIKTFYCDPSQPGYIEEFNRNSLTALKANNDIRKGVDIHYGLLKEHKLKIFRDNTHTIDEHETYHYPEPKDLKPDEHQKEVLPVGQNDHCMDANRYVSFATYRSDEKLQIKAPEDGNKKPLNMEEKIRKLKGGKKRFRGTENYGDL